MKRSELKRSPTRFVCGSAYNNPKTSHGHYVNMLTGTMLAMQNVSQCNYYLLKLELNDPKASGECRPPMNPEKSTLSLLTCLTPCA